MKKKSLLLRLFVSLCFFAAAAGLAAQSAQAAQAETLAQVDAEVAKLGNAVAAKLAALPPGGRVSVGGFAVMGMESPLGYYLRNELVSVLAEKAGNAYSVQGSDAGLAAARVSCTVAGEALRLGSTLRIYVRLSDATTASIIGVWHADLRLSALLEELAVAVRGSSSAPVFIVPDFHEPDSMDEPLAVEADGGWVARTIHQGDTDWFAVAAAASARMVFETSGSLDTRMELYDAESRAKLDDDDDSGDGANARIVWNVVEGKRYIIKVWGYDSSDIGPYSFRVRWE